ncbi:hypothetical protein NPIL_48461 [Nephila pilipes]|uniref:Uncharacterized protein n=1 Tax=Nephila pilipes TaxID=299642 RepID=A0A8X6ILB8_NEPPI|nr:hypothetical protein NPIL_48461 [Nephila pilipes]
MCSSVEQNKGIARKCCDVGFLFSHRLEESRKRLKFSPSCSEGMCDSANSTRISLTGFVLPLRLLHLTDATQRTARISRCVILLHKRLRKQIKEQIATQNMRYIFAVQSKPFLSR